MNWDAWWSGACTVAAIVVLVLATGVLEAPFGRWVCFVIGVVLGIASTIFSHDAVSAHPHG